MHSSTGVSVELYQKVNEALDEIRPYLREDGGDIDLLEISDDYTAILQFTGACKTCSMNQMTLTSGVEEAIRRSVPSIQKIITR